MRKVNRNIFTFIFAALFTVSGLFSLNLAVSVKNALTDFARNIKSDGVFSAFGQFTDDIEDKSSKELSCHDRLMDIYSVFNRAQNIRIIDKDDTTVVLTDENYLMRTYPRAKDEALDSNALKVKRLQEAAFENGAGFLYVCAPNKNSFLSPPANVTDFDPDNYSRFVAKLEKQGVAYLDLRERMELDSDIPGCQRYFVTDHHWTPETGLWAAGEICRELSGRYGFYYRKDYTDISNFSIKTYKNWFLGSLGKKTGTFFSPYGADDFDIIAPKFATDFTVEQPGEEDSRSGSFDRVLIVNSKYKDKDYYNSIPYTAYNGGDFRFQTVTNNLNKTGSDILIIRDSFACTVTPFLALSARNLYIADLRDFDYFSGEKLDIEEFIQEKKPDYVMVLYSGVYGEYDFD